MGLVIAFAAGLLLGIALGVSVALLVTWTRERLEKQRSYANYAQEIRGATENLRGLFTQEVGNRREAFGQVAQQLQVTEQQTQELLRITGALHHALSHPIVRGQWGQRMVEDVLRPIGFEEGIHYLKQATTNAGSGRPDYTFLLPRGLKVHLDAKFPLDNYLQYYAATTDGQRTDYRKRFLQDVRQRLQEVASRDYVNPAENTIDCALLFIPNEQVFSFINVHDPRLFDEALKSKVVLCSPWTLYPVLSVIRLALDHFLLERTTRALFPVLAGFEKQWQAFHDCLEKMGRRLADAQKEFDQLTTTRQRQLDRVLAEIDTLRHSPEDHLLGVQKADAAGVPVDRAPAVETAAPSGEFRGQTHEDALAAHAGQSRRSLR
jgi:DNA recombination protein RmuC